MRLSARPREPDLESRPTALPSPARKDIEMAPAVVEHPGAWHRRSSLRCKRDGTRHARTGRHHRQLSGAPTRREGTMPSTTAKIDRDQRDGLYELVRNHLGA